jgi:hypothetical protein
MPHEVAQGEERRAIGQVAERRLPASGEVVVEHDIVLADDRRRSGGRVGVGEEVAQRLQVRTQAGDDRTLRGRQLDPDRHAIDLRVSAVHGLHERDHRGEAMVREAGFHPPATLRRRGQVDAVDRRHRRDD